MARLNDKAIRLIEDEIEAEREIGSPKLATALELLLEWYRAAAADLVATGRRYRHLKRGTAYTVIGDAELQTSRPLAEGDILRLYRGDDGRMWVRPADEFMDGRFEEVAP